jgi:hypothetical protein
MSVQHVTGPLNVWYSDGVEYRDYRLADGRKSASPRQLVSGTRRSCPILAAVIEAGLAALVSRVGLDRPPRRPEGGDPSCLTSWCAGHAICTTTVMLAAAALAGLPVAVAHADTGLQDLL